MDQRHSEELRVTVSGGSVWGSRVGQSENILLAVHGGPGMPSDYLAPLNALALSDAPAPELSVVRYDQLGCGRSDPLTDRRLMTVERSVEELTSVILRVSTKPVHLLGHSWGAVVATELTLRRPELVNSLILASPSINIPRWLEDAKRLRKKLPLMTQMIISQAEREQNFTSAAYLKALNEYYQQFIYGTSEPFPEVTKSAESMNSLVYNTMWGPNELVVNGTLANYDTTPKLGQIDKRVLLTCGRSDEASPEACEEFQKLLPNSTLQVFEKSAHFPHLSEKESYLDCIRSYLLG